MEKVVRGYIFACSEIEWTELLSAVFERPVINPSHEIIESLFEDSCVGQYFRFLMEINSFKGTLIVISEEDSSCCLKYIGSSTFVMGAFCIFLILNDLQFPHSVYKHNVGNCKSFRIRNLTKIASSKSGTSDI
jgi:hypothetical protein